MQPTALLCDLPQPHLWIFSETVPSFVYYSHLPVIIISLVLAFYILKNGKRQLSSTILFFTIVAFVIWVFLDSIFWASNRSDVVMFVWSVIILIEPLVHAGIFYLQYVLVNKQDLPFQTKLLVGSLFIPLLIFVPTAYTLSAFNITECLAIESFFGLYYSYSVEFILIALIAITAVRGFLKEKVLERRREIVYLSLGTLIFLIAFTGGNLIGSFTSNWQVGQFGVLGMPIFMAILAYVIVRFKTFNIKLIAAQALVFSFWFLLMSTLFMQTVENMRIVNTLTLAVSLALGYQLIKNVKHEIDQREKIEKLAHDLEAANARLKELDKLKTEFVSIASHQLRSPLAAIRGYASMLIEGSFGKLSLGAHEAVGRIFSSSALMARSVDDFLNVSRIELGRMKYDLSEFDMCKLVETVIEEQTPIAEDKKLKLKFFKDKSITSCDIFADIGKIKQVVTNFVDNAIKYTPRGSVTVTFSHDLKKKMVRVGVTDTGIGMSQETIKKLFAKFARADNANKVNVIGTGLGLYVAKQLIEAHGGRTWAESPGDGKGSTFFFELPMQAVGEAIIAATDSSPKPAQV